MLWNNTTKRHFVMLLKSIMRNFTNATLRKQIFFFNLSQKYATQLLLTRFTDITLLDKHLFSVCADRRRIQHELIMLSAIINCRKRSTCYTWTQASQEFSSPTWLYSQILSDEGALRLSRAAVRPSPSLLLPSRVVSPSHLEHEICKRRLTCGSFNKGWNYASTTQNMFIFQETLMFIGFYKLQWIKTGSWMVSHSHAKYNAFNFYSPLEGSIQPQ